jgi:hypothetical protein
MWEGHELVLCDYGLTICEEWIGRGYQDSCAEKIHTEAQHFLTIAYEALADNYRRPRWLGMTEFHRSHRSNLLRKDYKHYSQFWPRTPTTIEYVWPTKIGLE